jgi:lipid-A-disaccharide synthase
VVSVPNPIGGVVAGKRILLSVGDDSGDLHASSLMAALQDIDGDLEFMGFGFRRMEAAGLKQLCPPHESVIWLANAFRIAHFRRRLCQCRRLLQAGGVDLVIPIDFGGFNLYLCREATRYGVPVFYYIPPQVWAHGRYRLKKLRRWTTRVGLIYPFEQDLYDRYGVQAEYVGHPLFDHIAATPPSETTVATLRDRFGEHLVGVLPGSRRQEVRAHMPVLIECRRRVLREFPDARFAMLAAPSVRNEVRRLLDAAGAPVPVLEDVRPAELARAACVCLAKSGTVTLETASQLTPTVVFYRPSAPFYFIGMGLSETPYMSIVNVLAQRMVCPEKPLRGAGADWVTAQALQFLRDPGAREDCRAGIAEAVRGFAEPGGSARAARSALSLVGTG